MQLGVTFPQTEIGGDAGAVRAYAQTVEQLGYRHLLAYDHVIGADPAIHAPWTGPYDIHTTFHEPFVLYGYLAALTSLELVTGVIIMPQRQTVLVAKQAAEVDLLTGGKLTLGLGSGWNAVEYEALDKDFTNRGRRLDEQIELLRRLMTEECVTFAGEYEQVTGAGINPMPIQRPIPIWIGGQSAPAYRRAGRTGDGWFPQMQPGPKLEAAAALVAQSAREAGRDPASLGMHGRVNWTGGMADALAGVDAWRQAGATHLAVNTMRAGLGGVDGHLAVLTELAAELPLG